MRLNYLNCYIKKDKMESYRQQKQIVLSTIECLNREILKNFIQLKKNFESSHIANSEISNTLKSWKPTFQSSVNACLKPLFEKSNKLNLQGISTNLSSIVKQLTKIYGSDQQYIEKIKCLNSSTQMIKQYIRIKAIKDPTTAVFQNQPAPNILI